MKAIQRIIIFFDLWGSYHYEERIGMLFAWELAGIFAEHNIEWDDSISFVERER